MADKKLTGKIARERIRSLPVPRPPEGIIDGYRACERAQANPRRGARRRAVFGGPGARGCARSRVAMRCRTRCR